MLNVTTRHPGVETSSNILPSASAAKNSKARGWNLGQGFTAAVGIMAAFQGLKAVDARIPPAPAPAPHPLAPTAAPSLAPQAHPAPAPLAHLPPPPPPPVTTSGPVPVTNGIYERCAVKLSNGNSACLQGLPLGQVQGLVSSSSVKCDNFLAVQWSLENTLALQKGQKTYAYSDAVLFEVPETSRCCTVYETTSPQGCGDTFPQQAQCTLTDRSCVAFGISSMQDIAKGVAPPAFNGAGHCQAAGSGTQIDCLTQTNVFIPGVGSTTAPSGGSVQVSNGCSVSSSGVLSGSCTINPTDAIAG